LLSSKSVSDFKSNSNLVLQNISDTNQANNKSNTNNNTIIEAHPGTPSNSVESNGNNAATMKSKVLKQRSFVIDDFERPSPDAHVELNTAFIEADVKNLKDNGKYFNLLIFIKDLRF